MAILLRGVLKLTNPTGITEVVVPDFDYSRPGVRMGARASRGRVHRLGAARFSSDVIYLPSDSELAVYLWCYFQRGLRHLAVQVDCEPADTLRIADELGIKHPLDRGKGEPSMLSTDLIATYMEDRESRVEAINVKHFSFNTEQSRFRRLCSIEARYHYERGAQWRLAISQGLNTNWAKNLNWLHSVANDFYRFGFSSAESEAQSIFLARLKRPRGASTIRDMCRHLRESGAMSAGAPVAAYRQLLATRRLWADMNVRELMDLPPEAVYRPMAERCR